MKRRTFLQNGMMVSASIAISGLTRFGAYADTSDNAQWRTFVLTTTIEIVEPAGDIRV